MSIEGSNKEYIFSLYTKLCPSRLENTLGLKFDDIFIERQHGDKRRVDISAIDIHGRRVLIDWSLKSCDKEHYNQIRQLIYVVSCMESSVLVLGATSFNNKDSMFELIKEVMLQSNRHIELIFVKINDDVIPILEELNQLDCLEQMKNLEQKLNLIDKHFELVQGVKNYNSNKAISAKLIDSQYCYDHKQLLLLDILKRLRVDSPHINLYKYKKIDGNSFSIGAGMGEISYNIRWDKRNRLICEVGFSNNKGRDVYFKLLEKKEEIDNYMDYMLTWIDSPCKIFTYINPLTYQDRDRMIKHFCRIVRKYIYGLHKFIIEEIKNIQNSI